MKKQKQAVVYYHIPPDSQMDDTQMVSEVDRIKTLCRQCNLIPANTFIDRSDRGSMYKSVLDYTADPVHAITAFICVTAGSQFPELSGTGIKPQLSEQTDKPIAGERFTGGGVPYGFKISANGTLEVDEICAPVVSDIFKLKSSGDSLQHIADMLNQKHILSPRGGAWTKQAISFIIKNQSYCGEYHYEGKIKKIPKIISRQLFNKCQRV